jgi:hypothetical protein
MTLPRGWVTRREIGDGCAIVSVHREVARMRRRVMYVERCTSGRNSEAWIGWVAFSKTGRTVYTRGLKLHRYNGATGNHVDPLTGDEYWVSGVKKDRTDRHWAGSGPVDVEADARQEYERATS